MQKRVKPQEAKKPDPKNDKPLSQQIKVYDYLLYKGRLGATNFEMMINLRICDVRKRITDINRGEYACRIESEFEEAPNGKRYKRYWAVPWGKELSEYLNETKRTTPRHGASRAPKRGKRTV